MRLPFGQGKAQAREELAELLFRITERIERLETTPRSPALSLEIEKHVSIQLAEIRDGMSLVTGRTDGLILRAADIEKKLKDLTFAVAEGIERVSRSERRVDATIKRARKELKGLGYESAGLEAEAEELRIVDGGGGKDGEVSEVPEGVGSADTPSSIRGVTAAQLRRVRGIG